MKSVSKPFPQPHRVGGSTRWSPADLSEWEQEQKLNLPELTGMATVRQIAARYGVSASSIWRLAANGRKVSAKNAREVKQ